MADTKTPATSANKLAMSRALGAAFLNHQVEQLEKSVSNGPASGNWRDRKQAQANAQSQQPPTVSKRPPHSPGLKAGGRKRGGEIQIMAKNKDGFGDEVKDKTKGDVNSRRKSSDSGLAEKEANIVVVDASVLVHALYQVKKWCKDGREEIVIVPLEALNTLDLLKKGTSPLAQRARTASRILEAQVGTNPRIRVQRDDAFVLWDKITFQDLAPDANETDKDRQPLPPNNSPEWVRRIICCARWEVDNAVDTPPKSDTNPPSIPAAAADTDKQQESIVDSRKPKVVLAVLASSHTSPLSPQADVVPLTPVPLPAPSQSHASKHEVRSSGVLVAHWAARAGVDTLQVQPTQPGMTSANAGSGNGRASEDEERPKRLHPHAYPHHGQKGRRAPQNAITEGGGKAALVERPPAVMAMMEMVAQPSKVVRVLARGEKLDPDP